jgi:hypothetical protein
LRAVSGAKYKYSIVSGIPAPKTVPRLFDTLLQFILCHTNPLGRSLGGALFISVAQTLFQNGLLAGIERNAPQLDAQLFLESGATQIRQILAELNQEDALEVVLQAYVDGLTHVYWITTACAIAAFLCCCGLEWKSVKQGRGQAAKQTDSETAGGKETIGNNVVGAD